MLEVDSTPFERPKIQIQSLNLTLFNTTLGVHKPRTPTLMVPTANALRREDGIRKGSGRPWDISLRHPSPQPPSREKFSALEEKNRQLATSMRTLENKVDG